MQQIKFRGKRSNSGDWIYGGITTDKKFIVDRMTFIPVDPDTVGQFTGICDIANREIYEGDIVRDVDWINTVTYNHKQAAFLLDDGCGIDENTCEVLGTIFDNPELLEKKQ